LFQEHKQKIIATRLNSIDELEELETQEQNKYKKETRQEPQLPVSASEISAPTDIL
jgi:hypothetical protein